jgi:hypothetical protein
MSALAPFDSETRRDEAECLAIAILNFIASNEKRLVQFLDLTGLQPNTIRSSARSQLFLRKVLDYTAGNRALLAELERDGDVRPEAIEVARMRLVPQMETEASANERGSHALSSRRSVLH